MGNKEIRIGMVDLIRYLLAQTIRLLFLISGFLGAYYVGLVNLPVAMIILLGGGFIMRDLGYFGYKWKEVV